MARPSLNDLTAFVAVATHRNFRRAADEIGTAPSTLSHAMRALEERMGVRLLNRTTRSVSPTEAGYRLLGRLQPALASLDEALDSVAGFRGKVAGTVRINAPRLVAGLLVRTALPRMAELHPDVTVDIVVDGRLIDIVSGGFDAGVRPFGSVPKDMITVLLARPLTFICVASPAYLDRFGEPGTPEELLRHHCIGHRMPSGKLYRWEFERAGQELALEANGTIVLDDEELMVEAAIGGLGVAYVANWAVEAALSEGSLRKILTAWVPAPEEVAVYYPGHRAVPPALRAFLDIVKELRKKGP
ncbi:MULTISPECIES: LysR family transcriptional regulator [Mesorhizobium]|uniref:DNA-binding transcriptional LysR family regulator n=1 Tax=Mesorhizobium shonense TaxID=1209948 RepID=A0ABV2I2J9_9HYPH|nr:MULTISPECIES: LysR family transcriptional regulator [unclassified Mesorhizobium]AZO28445.1 LysR family transcriptional regulator [Mesorhizobium sp. M1B.F.Ca.ET.045.04.1.1]RWA66198.1 MAG: LysR family transcriptional regulator [Mesorhizobium sp.]RWA81783.1 MAG: LysR family transcriptional regulator [Mesorhizobium sp.]RWB18681.1 MAG: LysR family transcriptional regulator [Mesorhizobium sp.]TIS45523.1 MAG: LysR family transcriptional regulator [Mesorhizobium sp.]